MFIQKNLKHVCFFSIGCCDVITGLQVSRTHSKELYLTKVLYFPKYHDKFQNSVLSANSGMTAVLVLLKVGDLKLQGWCSL
jgi:hypothetical protein